MTAEPTGRVMWSPDPIRQRLASHTLEDVLTLPADAPRVELTDGVMTVVPILKAPFEIRLPIRDITP
jgi:hypothetical protein